MSPPTVALVAHAIHDLGGMERSLAELLRRAEGRYRFVVIATELATDLRPLVEWKRIPVPTRPMPLRFVAFAALAGARLARVRADVVHTMGAVVPNRVDLATVQYCHRALRSRTGRLAPDAAPPLRRLNTTLTTLLSIAAERWCYRTSRLRRLAAVSSGGQRELERHFPGVPVTVTPNGVDVERFRPDRDARERVRAELGADGGDFVTVFVGGDWDRKGLDLAIDGLAGIPAARLWVVGPGDEARFGLHAGRRGVRATFLGRRGDTERYYQGADAFVLPTLYETFSIASYEAAACGLPLVATAVNGVEELLEGEGGGIAVERDAESVAAALRRLAAEPDLRARLGEQGRGRARQFTWQRSADSVYATYDGLLA